jgi:glutamine synthetase
MAGRQSVSPDDILGRAQQDQVRFIQLQFADIHGLSKCATIPLSQLGGALQRGVWFDGSSVEGFTRICESDMYLKPDASTYAVLPGQNHETSTARLICDVYTPDGQPFEGDPRQILKQVLEEAQRLGLRYCVGPELEFFLFKKAPTGQPQPVADDAAGYFDFAPRDTADEVRKRIVSALESMNLEVEMSHHEVAPGQHEIDFKYGDALTQADRCMTFKHTVRSLANEHGLYASFMPKPIYGKNGSGMHVHQSLFSIATGRNAFYEPDDRYQLSKLARHFIAGQLRHARGFCAVTAPTVNSYKRLVPGYEAPVYVCWARRNRSALIRIPLHSKDQDEATRCELRCPDPSCNPYLAFAVMLQAGLAGIAEELAPPEPMEEDVYAMSEAELRERRIGVLPGTLGEAIAELERDEVIMKALGARLGPAYLRGKKQEWNTYRTQVTEWEMQAYFDRL